MSTEQLLEKFISEHPDYWEFENEVQEVKRLKALCENRVMRPFLRKPA